ncbi:MAG: SUMF1/EgtB/PvdO family nonheme iron enzyme [Elusimicrobia bacterium]|nr:SUMF1/EgtB/PvdO family nonheme iron enzyme [Elusimicrobiota bacterium]
MDMVLAGVLAAALAGVSWGAQWPDLSSPSAGAGGGEKDAAVVVGVERYGEDVAPVPGARQNAQDWYSYLTKSLRVPVERVELLRDKKGVLEKMRKAAAKAASEAEPGGTLWFVFIGHGVPAKDGSDGLLVGADAQQDVDLLYSRSLSQRELLETLAKGRQARTVLVLDACFSGRTPEGKPLVKGLQPLVLSAPPAALGPGVFLFTAARSDQFAGALPGAGRPAFSYLALGGLRGWADEDKDGKVTAAELAGYSRKALSAVVKDRTQEPELIGGAPSEVLGRGSEAGPDLADLVLQGGGGAMEFKVSALPEVPKAVAPSAEGLAAAAGGGSGSKDAAGGIDFGDVDALEKYDAVARFEKGDASPEEKARRWQAFAGEAPPSSKYARLGATRAGEWERYAGALKAAEEAKARRAETRDRDWDKLRRLLALSVVSPAEKQRFAKVFVEAYGRKLEDNPWLGELLAHLPPGALSPAERGAVAKAKAEELKALARAEDHAFLAFKDLPIAGKAPPQARSREVLVPSGEFLMGDRADKMRKVYLDAYTIDAFEVTVAQFRRFSKAARRPMPKQPDYAKDDHPVVSVSWDEAQAFCRWKGGGLPTEAQWEKAARAGTDTDHSFGDNDKGQLQDYAWCEYFKENETHPVGLKKPNPLGIYDLYGNVWEWVHVRSEEYDLAALRNPKGSSQGEGRVSRGGAWGSNAWACSSAARGVTPGGALDGAVDKGFRCARPAR